VAPKPVNPLPNDAEPPKSGALLAVDADVVAGICDLKLNAPPNPLAPKALLVDVGVVDPATVVVGFAPPPKILGPDPAPKEAPNGLLLDVGVAPNAVPPKTLVPDAEEAGGLAAPKNPPLGAVEVDGVGLAKIPVLLGAVVVVAPKPAKTLVVGVDEVVPGAPPNIEDEAVVGVPKPLPNGLVVALLTAGVEPNIDGVLAVVVGAAANGDGALLVVAVGTTPNGVEAVVVVVGGVTAEREPKRVGALLVIDVGTTPNGAGALLIVDAGAIPKGAETLVVVVVDATAKGLDAVVLVLETGVTLLALDTADVGPPN